MNSSFGPQLVQDVSSLFAPGSFTRTAALGTLAICLLSAFLSAGSKPYKGKRPPGPRGWPLVGNVFQLTEENWLTFMEWGKKYGPIVALNLAGQNTIILNSHKVAADILDKRAAIYSDRPRFIVSGEMMTGGLLITFARYGDVWRRMRRAAHEGLYAKVAGRYHGVQESEAVLLVDGLLKEPEEWDGHLKRTASSQIMAMVYDTPPMTTLEDPRILMINAQAQRLIKSAAPGQHLVEFFPWMQYLPNFVVPWKPWAKGWFERDSAEFVEWYETVKKRILSGDDRPSLVSNLIKHEKEYKFSDYEAAWVAGTMITAGGETSAAVMCWFMLAMTMYPEIQRKCQEEIDRVVGRDRMPVLDDTESMPYMRAMIRELMRWRPVDPIGLQHMSTEDDVYEGYFIPKGTIVIYNVWALNRDKEMYGEDVEVFRPERFLDEDGELAPVDPMTKGEGHVTYGYGRRICAGRAVANSTLFIDMVCILWGLTLEKARTPDGKEVEYSDSKMVNVGLVVRPVDFKTVLKPRFPEAAAVVKETMERVINHGTAL